MDNCKRPDVAPSSCLEFARQWHKGAERGAVTHSHTATEERKNGPALQSKLLRAQCSQPSPREQTHPACMCTSVLMPWENAATASDKLGRGQVLQKGFVGMQALILLQPTLNPRAGLQALLCSIPGQRGGALSNGTTCFPKAL